MMKMKEFEKASAAMRKVAEEGVAEFTRAVELSKAQTAKFMECSEKVMKSKTFDEVIETVSSYQASAMQTFGLAAAAGMERAKKNAKDIIAPFSVAI